jgi:hypothetical protein
MRLLLLSASLMCCAAALSLQAQDVPLPRPATQDPAPLEPTPAPAGTAPPAAPELIPADILPPPDTTGQAPIPDLPTIDQLDEGLKPPPLVLRPKVSGSTSNGGNCGTACRMTPR